MSWIVAHKPDRVFETRAEARRYAAMLLVVAPSDARLAVLKSGRVVNSYMGPEVEHPHPSGVRGPYLAYASGSGLPEGS